MTYTTLSHWVRRVALSVLFVCAPIALGDTSVFRVVEGAAEVETLTLKSAAAQIVYARECDSCALLALSVTPQTQYFQGNTRITLAAASARTNGATVFFDPEARTVSRIKYWTLTQ